ncbi:hypothetical protein SNEBB_004658 [Seison nebaliae]|nr:hypothetical protein SNEBB_004658 [Seison nebaliae]
MSTNRVRIKVQRESCSSTLRRRMKQRTLSTASYIVHHINCLDSAAIVIGLIIGSGIFVAPSGVLQFAKSELMCLILWLIASIGVLLGAFCYCALGEAIPFSGGDYTYIQKMFGDTPALIYATILICIIIPSANACSALTAAIYILKPLINFDCYQDESLFVYNLIATFLMISAFLLNIISFKYTKFIGNILTTLKIMSIFFLMSISIYKANISREETMINIERLWNQPITINLNIISAMSCIFYSFGGFNYLNFMGAEVHSKNLKLGVLIGVPFVAVIYWVSNFLYFITLPPKQIVDSPSVALTLSQKLPTNIFWIIVSFSVSLSCFGALTNRILSSSRVLFMVAKNGHAPNWIQLKRVNDKNPSVALLFVLLFSLILLHTTNNNIFHIMNYGVIFELLFMSLSCVGLIWKYPQSIFIKFATIIFCLFCWVVAMTTIKMMRDESSPNVWMTFLFPISYITIFLFQIHKSSKFTKYFRRINEYICLFFQKVFVAYM